MYILKIESKFRKLFFVFQIIAFDVVAGISLNYGRIHVIACRRVDKQSQDFRYHSETCFRIQFVLDYWKIAIKVLPIIFEQCLRLVFTFTRERCSETVAFWH